VSEGRGTKAGLTAAMSGAVLRTLLGTPVARPGFALLP
jgi:ABC-type cobalamin transport system permease subunit